MNKFERCALSLKKQFEAELPSFPINIQRHYAERLYRITGDKKKYIAPVRNYCLEKKDEFLDLVDSIDKPTKQKEIGVRYIQKIERKKTPRLLKRIPILMKTPEIKYLQELVWFLNKFSEYHVLDQILSEKKIQEVLSFLSHTNFMNYFTNVKIMSHDPVQTINTLYHLRELKVMNLVSDIITYVDTLFKETKSEEDFYNKLYFYTHILISESLYYQRHIKFEEYDWIYTFFQKTFDRIIQNQNNDIISEIGVCFKIARRTGRELQYIKDRIYSEIKQHGGLLLRVKGQSLSTLSKVEHRNVLSIMLFSDISKLYYGPHFKL